MNSSLLRCSHSFLSLLLLSSLLLVLAAGVPSIEGRSASVSAVLDVSRDRHPVSAGIYGTNGAPEYMVNGRITGSTRMGGGDPTTAYNWRIDADNAGFDCQQLQPAFPRLSTPPLPAARSPYVPDCTVRPV
jgi:hypothetical protein